jgi:hypothetical protein
MRVTLKSINYRLAELGRKALLEKGGGYFYFSGAKTGDWLGRIIKVPTLASLTPDAGPVGG